MWILDPEDFGAHPVLPLTSLGEAVKTGKEKAISAGAVLSDQARRCEPPGMPTMMVNEFAMEILQNGPRVTIISEMSPLVRTIYLDETHHTRNLEPSWNGHSIGHWSGSSLVVDTVNLNDKGSALGFVGVHSSTTHILERFDLSPEGDRLAIAMTFDDPRYLTKSWTGVYHYHRLPAHSELWEYACEIDAPGWSERFSGDPQAGVPAKH